MDEADSGVELSDLDLTRMLLLHLTKQERSPPEPIFISLMELAALWRASPEDVARAFEFLSGHAFVEGPGRFDPDFFLFRRVTAKGRALASAIFRPRDWKAIKAQYLA